MPVPTFDQFVVHLLRYLASHPGGVPTSEAHEAVADALNLTKEDRAERVASGVQPVYKNRNGWAHDRLKRAGYSTSLRTGVWKITEEGLKFSAAHPDGIPEADLERIIYVDRASRLRSRADVGSFQVTATGTVTPSGEIASSPISSPEERIESAVAELRESVGRDLLENIGRAPPEFFEHLVLDLLHAMGYGTSRDDLQRVGGSGDGGIDGVISLDKLGLEKVYIQAKRWKNSVGSPEIQGFMGALQLQGASKGVFITTSSFTKEAVNAAGKARGSFVLVDGARLANLMIDYGVGVSHKAHKVPKVDNDYFDEG